MLTSSVLWLSIESYNIVDNNVVLPVPVKPAITVFPLSRILKFTYPCSWFAGLSYSPIIGFNKYGVGFKSYFFNTFP